MKRNDLIAGGLTLAVLGGGLLLLRAGGATAPAPSPSPGPPPPSPGPPPGPARSRAYAVVRTALWAQPDAQGAIVGPVAAGTPMEVEAVTAPGWVYAEVQRIGLAPLEGYVLVSDISFTAPVLERLERLERLQPLAGQLDAAVDGVSTPVTIDAAWERLTGAIARSMALPIVRSLYAQYKAAVERDGGEVTSSFDELLAARNYQPRPDGPVRVLGQAEPWRRASLAFLTGEDAGPGRFIAAQAERARAALEADVLARGGPPLPAVSTLRSFAEQAGIVAARLRRNGVTAASDDSTLRRGLLEVLTTSALPGFSRHHWGTEIDVLTADSAAWRPGGAAAPFAAGIAAAAPGRGLYNPYREGAYPEPARAHYQSEPWHLSLAAVGEPLRQRWLREIGEEPAVLDALLARSAAAIATRAGLDPARLQAVMRTLDLPSYQRNVAPAGAAAMAGGVV